MQKITERFQVYNNLVLGETIGECWLGLLKITLESGNLCHDEGRERLAVRNVRVYSERQQLPDAIINTYANKENLEKLIDLTFKNDSMYDFDVVPSFSPKDRKSYYYRLKKGKLLEYVVQRLSKIPESKKAVMVFPNNEDCISVLTSPKDDYFPCLVSIQFRMQPSENGWILDTIFYARSIDVYQKSFANLWVVAKLSNIVANQVSKNRKENIVVGSLDGMIADAHIYNENFGEARTTYNSYLDTRKKNE